MLISQRQPHESDKFSVSEIGEFAVADCMAACPLFLVSQHKQAATIFTLCHKNRAKYQLATILPELQPISPQRETSKVTTATGMHL